MLLVLGAHAYLRTMDKKNERKTAWATLEGAPTHERGY